MRAHGVGLVQIRLQITMRVRFPAHALKVFDQLPAFRVYEQPALPAMAAHHRIDGIHPCLDRRILARDVDTSMILIRVLAEKLPHDVPIGSISRAAPTVSRGIAIDVDDQTPVLPSLDFHAPPLNTSFRQEIR